MNGFCTNCGAAIESGDNHCKSCGAKVNNQLETSMNNNQQLNSTSSTNGMAIAGFICAIIGFNIVGLILSIVGLSNAKKTNGSNKGLAIAGIIISIVRMIIYVIWFAVLIFAGLSGNLS